MSVFFNMIGIEIELYGHVLGPPRVSSIFEKNKFVRFISHFLMV